MHLRESAFCDIKGHQLTLMPLYIYSQLSTTCVELSADMYCLPTPTNVDWLGLFLLAFMLMLEWPPVQGILSGRGSRIMPDVHCSACVCSVVQGFIN